MADSESARAMWRAYLESLGMGPGQPSRGYTAFHFCDNARDADALAELVVAGRKRATAGAVWTYEHEGEPLPEVGTFGIVTGWRGDARCVIRTTAVTVVPFLEVGEAFARREGEGDGSLAYWRRVHWDYFGRELRAFGREPSEAMPILCEEFEVVFGGRETAEPPAPAGEGGSGRSG